MGETTGLEAKNHPTGCWSSTRAAFGFQAQAELRCECDLAGGGMRPRCVNVRCVASLLDALPGRGGLGLLVGDVDQLPSAGAGQRAFADLNQQRRHAGGPAHGGVPPGRGAAASSPPAHAINAGTIPDLRPPPAETTSDFYFLACRLAEQRWPLIFKVVGGAHSGALLAAIHRPGAGVLCPDGAVGCGSRSLNIELQQLLKPRTNPPRGGSASVAFAPGRIR